MLEVNNISAGYGNKQVLFDISLSIKRGEIITLAGSNGSGKSTLLKAIYGLLPLWDKNEPRLKNDGKYGVYFKNQNITGQASSALLKKGLLYIPQKNNLFDDLTVKENLEMAGLVIKNRKVLRARIEESLSLFPSLAKHLKRIPMNLSGGERQSLSLAMAILHKPQLILVDEPFNGLSPKGIEEIRKTLQHLNQQQDISILMIEHRIKEAILIAGKIIGLKLGKICCILPANSAEDIIFHTLKEVFI